MPRISSNMLALALAVGGAGVLAGCGVNSPNYGRQDPYRARQVHFDTQELQNDTAVGDLRVTRDQYGIMHVTVPIRSTIDKDLYVDYHVTFFDANGQPTGSFDGPTKTLKANTPDYVTFNSTGPAQDFQVDFRYARTYPL